MPLYFTFITHIDVCKIHVNVNNDNMHRKQIVKISTYPEKYFQGDSSIKCITNKWMLLDVVELKETKTLLTKEKTTRTLFLP